MAPGYCIPCCIPYLDICYGTMSPRQNATPDVDVAAAPRVTVAEGVLATPPVVRIRPCETAADYGACVRLQSRTWGADYRDVVTPSLLKVSSRIGGVVAGAYLRTGEMVGFVFGLTGIRGGRLVHWSHMLAVDAAYRDLGVGRRLKEHQWEVLREMGVETAYWTFDPLVARNAHLNLNRLAASLEEYVADMYPDTGSDLHSFGTDRFVVSWSVTGGEILQVRDLRPGPAPVVNVNPDGTPRCDPAEEEASRVKIEIPGDIEPLVVSKDNSLRRWRTSTRAAFQMYLARGYRLEGFERGSERGWYVLVAGPGGT